MVSEYLICTVVTKQVRLGYLPVSKSLETLIDHLGGLYKFHGQWVLIFTKQVRLQCSSKVVGTLTQKLCIILTVLK